MRKKISGLNQLAGKIRWRNTLLYYVALHGFILGSLLMCLTGCSSDLIISKPIALHKAGSVVEANFEIEQKYRVGFHLWFFVNDQPGDRDRLLDFLGRAPMFSYSVPKSTIVPLKVKLIKYTNAEESVIVDKTYSTSGLALIGGNELSRRIDTWSVESGRYRIRLETVETFPQLANTKVEFNLYYIRAPK